MIMRITIRPFTSADTPALIQLFKEAVNAINIDTDRFQKKLEKNIAFIAEIDSRIVGFADITHEGYLDRLYVHKDYQARWVALSLFKAIEKAARELGLTKITTDCSITAKVPAERMGFVTIKEQTVMRHGVPLVNYVMEKKL